MVILGSYYPCQKLPCGVITSCSKLSIDHNVTRHYHIPDFNAKTDWKDARTKSKTSDIIHQRGSDIQAYVHWTRQQHKTLKTAITGLGIDGVSYCTRRVTRASKGKKHWSSEYHVTCSRIRTVMPRWKMMLTGRASIRRILSMPDKLSLDLHITSWT